MRAGMRVTKAGQQAQGTVVVGLRAEATSIVGGSRLGCSGDKGYGGSVGSGH